MGFPAQKKDKKAGIPACHLIRQITSCEYLPSDEQVYFKTNGREMSTVFI